MRSSKLRHDGPVWDHPHRDPQGRLIQQAIAAAKRGDHRGLRYLYSRFSPEVFRCVLLIVRDYHDAEDVTHNVFANLPSRIRLYESRETPFGAWIIRVARNTSIDYLRVSRPVPTEDLQIGQSDETVPRGALRAALGQLPADQREVLVLRHIVGLRPAEIARLLGKSESAVHGLHNRGRRTLKASLVELGAAPAVRAA
jgi:RNA polymerase sigma-70 factor, ECF subfamily